jgi:hypothetical protein
MYHLDVSIFVTHHREDGHMIGRNMQELYYVYNIFSYTYVHLLVLATISSCNVRLKKIKTNILFAKYTTFQFTELGIFEFSLNCSHGP